MNSYKLLTPGPLTTTDTVKQVMLFDHCTWDDDYKQITQTIQPHAAGVGTRVRAGVHRCAHAGQRNLWQ